MSVAMLLAAAAWFCLSIGLLERGHRLAHSRWMRGGIFLDLVIVGYLQATQSAVQKALSFSLDWMGQVHVVFSALAVVLYLPVLALGYRLLRGEASASLRRSHVVFAISAFSARTVGFVFMFSMIR